MTHEQVLDEIILPLADEFEAGNRHYRTFTQSTPEEFESLRERIAMLVAEGSLVDFLKSRSYQLTPAGYAKYKPRIDALRVLSR